MNEDRFKLLVFDWDGTLINSIERIVTSMQHASREVCGIKLSEDRARRVIGLGLHEAIQQLHPELGTAAIESVAASYRQNFLFDSDVPEVLFDGVEALLQQLVADGYTLAIATGKSRAGLDRTMQQHQLVAYFATTRCADETRSKPHPAMLHSILDELGTQTRHAVMIGDSEHDMRMANNAGVDAIGVSQGVEPADSLLAHQPLTCLDKITDLYDFLSHNTKDSFIHQEAAKQ
jgi:phosphoglycolate phosphatase